MPDGPAAAAEQNALSWLEGAVLPPGAVSSPTAPTTTPSFSSQYYSWWCSPMVELTAYWTIVGARVAETANWLSANPTADLIVPVPASIPEDADVDMASVGNVPSRDALEGIAYTVARTSDGVAIRAEIGVIPESAVCPTPPPGVGLGGPGQG